MFQLPVPLLHRKYEKQIYGNGPEWTKFQVTVLCTDILPSVSIKLIFVIVRIWDVLDIPSVQIIEVFEVTWTRLTWITDEAIIIRCWSGCRGRFWCRCRSWCICCSRITCLTVFEQWNKWIFPFATELNKNIFISSITSGLTSGQPPGDHTLLSKSSREVSQNITPA